MNRRFAAPLLALALTSLVLVGCSDDDDEPSACAELQDAADGVRELGSTELIADGTDAARQELDDISDDLAEAKSAAGDQFGDEIDAVESAIDDVTSTISDLGDTPISEIGSELTSGLEQVQSAWDDLAASVDADLGDCDLDADS